MKPQHPARTAIAALAVIALAALVSGGCSKKRTSLIPNQPPEVRLTAAPARVYSDF